MVTSVLPMMMMTIFSLSLVEFVVECHTNHCHPGQGVCYDDGKCYWHKDGTLRCCPAGDGVFGTAGCCKPGYLPYAFGTCCNPDQPVLAVLKKDGIIDHLGCCAPGDLIYGTSGCCDSWDSPFAFGGCCPKGAKAYSVDGKVGCCDEGTRPWQLDDGYMTCCEKGKTCARTKSSDTRHLRDPKLPTLAKVAASDGHSESGDHSAMISRSKLPFIDHDDE